MKRNILVLLMFLGSFSIAFAQNRVSGTVVDSESNPLVGVTVIIKGTQTGVTTDVNGQYSMNIAKNDILVYSFIGMIKQEITYNGQGKINVSMIPDNYDLEDVVVIGYGTSKKSDLTGSIASVKSDDLKNTKVGLAGNALQGMAAGVQVTQPSAKPGADASIVIRGKGSVNAGNSPLVIVDGIPSSLGDVATGDIESIEILKDASAASIYGNRGSNGVILITTKKGSAGKTRVSFNVQGGALNMMNKMDLMNSQQYYDLVTTSGQNYTWTTAELLQLSRGETTDWQNAVTQPGSFQNYNATVSGGNEKSTHFLGLDYYDQEGVVKNSWYNRLTLRYNNDSKLNDWINMGVRFNFMESKIKNINEESDELYGTMYSAISSQPTAPIYDTDGEYFDGFLNTKANPVAIVNLLDRTTQRTNMNGSFYIEFEPVEKLKIKTDNAGQMGFNVTNEYEDPRMGQHYSSEGVASISNSKNRYWQTENTITYENSFDVHKIKVMGGASASKSEYQHSLAQAKGIDPITKYYNLGGGSEYGPNNSYASASTLTSFYIRANYNYKERYLLTFTMRADGSSKFAPGHRWGYFPSLAAAWRITEEDFMKNFDKIDNLKLRISAGMLGNQSIGDYRYSALVSRGGENNNYVLNGNLYTGATYTSISNPNLTWEKSSQVDIALDYGFFKNHIAGSIEYYYKRSTDLLWSVILPLESGYQSSLTNVGILDNSGIELTINTVNVNTYNFQWTTSFNFTYNHNNVVELYDGKTDINKSIFIGHSLGEYYLLESDGIWQMNESSEAAIYNAQPGDRKIKDLTPDNQINSDDRTFCGQSTPKYYGGMSNTFKYKGLDLVVFINYAGGYYINNSMLRFFNSYNTWGNSSVDYYNNYWKEERPSNKYPAPRIGSSYSNGDGTNANLEDGTFIRIKNLELGYTLPHRWTDNIKATSIRGFISVQNLYTFTKYSGYDVEASQQSNTYPGARAFIGGVSINF
ncbi:TonB-dependent receptor [Mariniphaga sediminis]|jgi:TonB-linked SusC/RagA family outer membrane protein|uniref:TonB-dependent receptor n=1 Tax=Mariniphaga sediminis TaxID=1628158 RepID=A0A399D0V3_9BACT|nr:TonB-dependent receptor [Mariniphaga sediminis]RIH65207.1 TonB-dependent receptor [Mariniphaga sediminis]